MLIMKRQHANTWAHEKVVIHCEHVAYLLLLALSSKPCRCLTKLLTWCRLLLDQTFVCVCVNIHCAEEIYSCLCLQNQVCLKKNLTFARVLENTAEQQNVPFLFSALLGIYTASYCNTMWLKYASHILVREDVNICFIRNDFILRNGYRMKINNDSSFWGGKQVIL